MKSIIAFLFCLLPLALATTYTSYPSNDVHVAFTQSTNPESCISSTYTQTGNLKVQNTVVFGHTSRTYSYIEFSLPAGVSGAITSASLKLTVATSPSSNVHVEVFQTGVGWVESGGCAGLQTLGTSQASGIVSGTAGSTITLDLTVMVQAAINASATQVSVRVTVQPAYYEAADFYSRSEATASRRPTLEIVQ